MMAFRWPEALTVFHAQTHTHRLRIDQSRQWSGNILPETSFLYNKTGRTLLT